VGVQVVAGREDVDALTYETVNDPDYSVERVYVEWKATARLSVKARVENLLDEAYQPVNGYPALGRGAFGELDWKL
jgi:vitamin B12 transporter